MRWTIGILSCHVVTFKKMMLSEMAGKILPDSILNPARSLLGLLEICIEK